MHRLIRPSISFSYSFGELRSLIMAGVQHNNLSLNKKVEVIKMYENKVPVKMIQREFQCGKTQVYNIIKNKEKIKTAWLSSPGSRSRKRTSSYVKLDQIVFEWFTNARSKSLPVSGPILKEQAKQVAEELDLKEFKASNGWLDCFKARHAIVWKSISGEANDVDQNVVEEWKSKILHIIKNYQAKNVYNCDETGLFFRGIPSKTFSLKAGSCVGGKHAKERLTVLLCCNMEGNFEKPLVIGKSLNPRCFKNLDVASLPIVWKANSKSWMTSQIMEEFLVNFNNKMKEQKRHVILFLDNAGCHPKINLSHVQLAFLPPNTTANTQPLDQGIIQNIKCHYRKYLLRCLINNINNVQNASEVIRSVTV